MPSHISKLTRLTENQRSTLMRFLMALLRDPHRMGCPKQQQFSLLRTYSASLPTVRGLQMLQEHSDLDMASSMCTIWRALCHFFSAMLNTILCATLGMRQTQEEKRNSKKCQEMKIVSGLRRWSSLLIDTIPFPSVQRRYDPLPKKSLFLSSE